MKRAKVTSDGIVLAFTGMEADLLTNVAEQLAELLGGADERDGDPALERLLPDGYRGDAENAAEFRRFTQTELVDDKLAGAHTIVETLRPRTPRGGARVSLSQQEAVAWLRSLNDIRLALAARLGIVDDDYRPSPTDQGFAIYAWLGMVQASLLHAVDR